MTRIAIVQGHPTPGGGTFFLPWSDIGTGLLSLLAGVGTPVRQAWAVWLVDVIAQAIMVAACRDALEGFRP